MKWLMLCREPRLYSCKRLKQAANLQGIELDILDPNRFLLRIEQGELTAYYQFGEPFQQAKLTKLPDYQAVIPRFGTASTEMGCRVLSHYELRGVVTLNQASAFQLARDKWLSLAQLAAAGIPLPDSQLHGELVSGRRAVNFSQTPLVVKTLSGSQGVGVMLAENVSTAAALVETLQAGKINTLQQHFVAEAAGQDVRAFVIGDKVVAAMQRRGKAGEFRANIAQGGEAQTIQLTVEEQALALRASKTIGLDVAGVDLIRSKNGLMVLEINASPGLEMIEYVSRAPIADMMIAHLFTKLGR